MSRAVEVLGEFSLGYLDLFVYRVRSDLDRLWNGDRRLEEVERVVTGWQEEMQRHRDFIRAVRHSPRRAR